MHDTTRGWRALSAVFALCVGCSTSAPAGQTATEAIEAEAGFVELAPRDVVLHGRSVSLTATSKLFWNFRPADSEPADKPLIVLFNGFASDVVRAFGTGPTTVEPDGTVVPNPDSLTRVANLLYIDPRQSGFSYDVEVGGAPSLVDCSQDVFNEYVDAADVLLATLSVLRAHPGLHGPVYWLGESYAGVRIQWILAYLREAWSLAPYQDDTLKRELGLQATQRFLSGEILLQPGFLGATHATAIQAACSDPALLAAVQASVSGACPTANACACANGYERSAYNYTLSDTEQEARIFAADAAQVSAQDALALYGVRLESIPELSGSQRTRGFKCSPPDEATPDQSALSTLLGPLPEGQSYNLGYSPLTPGKGTSLPDWNQLDLVGTAFLDNAQHVDAFVTDGARDLVVREAALAPTLRAISPLSVTESADQISLGFAGGARSITVRHYPSAGHMITMIEPHAFAADLSAWLAQRAAH